MRNTLIRIVATSEHPYAAYVSSVGRDGGFAITRRKDKARPFVPATACETIARLQAAGHTRMQFDTCPAEVAHA